MSFDGFRPATFDWFAGLEADNSRDWFGAHREAYDHEVRGPLTALLEELAGDAPVWVARPNRDLRFAKDRSRPYKDRCYGTIDGRLYAQISAAGLFAGTGAYRMDAGQLTRFRDAVVDETSGGALESIVGALDAGGLDVWGESLKTAPRGYPRDHPRVALLRHKLLIAGASAPPDAARGLSRDACVEHLRDTWTACAPLLAWLDEHVGEGAEAGAKG
ncbi:MAG TPA: DUF2461 domain-containing protein [Baekduia sp.]|uniref:DUF2461 domain-containing protein n=1 Tax=Baekduia sp. TaxID=2600305 RepID=UPI002D78DA5E|nr:DUF2461 domain-containing protein [Baekduia sp.]HET6506739.1 DUF2461 domain-containing protein [Baekduia sp.]